MPSIDQNSVVPKTRKIAVPTPPSSRLRARNARRLSLAAQVAKDAHEPFVDVRGARARIGATPNKPVHGLSIPTRAARIRPRAHKHGSLWPRITGSALGYLYATTVGVVMHEVLGHGLLGVRAMTQCPDGLQYWTHAVRQAARDGIPELPAHHRYWQADWVDNMLLHGPIVGTVRQLATLDGRGAAPNDTAWPWNRLDDEALQGILRGFAANYTRQFDKSLGFISGTLVDDIHMTRLRRRLGHDGAEVWISLAGSVPGFALVCGAWSVARDVEKSRPVAAAVAASFGSVLHAFNVVGMRGDITDVAFTLAKQRVPRSIVAMALMLGAIRLPFIVDAAARARQQADATPQHLRARNRAVHLDRVGSTLRGAQKVLLLTLAVSFCIEPGRPFSEHIAFALPAIAVLGLTCAWLEAERGGSIAGPFYAQFLR